MTGLLTAALLFLSKLRQKVLKLRGCKLKIHFDELEKIGSELEQIKLVLKDLVELNKPPVPSVIRFYTLVGGIKQRVVSMFLKVSQEVPVSIQIKDKFGNAAAVDGLPSWAVTDAALATLVVAEDGLSAVVKPVGPLGSFKVQVSADADLGEGVKTILGELDVELLAGEAAVIELAAGEAVDQA